jgi:hypothetical protein
MFPWVVGEAEDVSVRSVCAGGITICGGERFATAQQRDDKFDQYD